MQKVVGTVIMHAKSAKEEVPDNQDVAQDVKDGTLLSIRGVQ